MSAAITLAVASDLPGTNPAGTAPRPEAGAEKQTAEFSTLARTVLQGMRHQQRNQRIVRMLLEGHSYHWICRSTGLPATTIAKIRRRMTLLGFKCACGAALNHLGPCRERLKNFPPRGRRARIAGRCRNGHPYTPKNRYIHGNCDTCRVCNREAKKRRRTLKAERQSRSGNVANFSLLAGYRPTPRERGAAGSEARSLFACLGRAGQTVESLRASIRVSGEEEKKLRALARKGITDAESVTDIVRFRELVIIEFDKLAKQPKNAALVARAQATAHAAAAVPAPRRSPGELTVTVYEAAS